MKRDALFFTPKFVFKIKHILINIYIYSFFIISSIFELKIKVYTLKTIMYIIKIVSVLILIVTPLNTNKMFMKNVICKHFFLYKTTQNDKCTIEKVLFI